MFHSKAFIILLISASICYGFPTKDDPLISKEAKNNSDQEAKVKDIKNIENVKLPQINISDSKVLNNTESKITIPVEEKLKTIKTNENDKIHSETLDNSSDKDSQKTPLSSQNGPQISLEAPMKTQDDEKKKIKLPEVKESTDKGKDKVEETSDNMETEKVEKSKNKETEKEHKEVLKDDNKLSDDANRVEKEKQTNENQPPVDNVFSEKQSTIKEIDKNKDLSKDPLYNSEDINISEEKDKDKEDTYNAEYDDRKNIHEKENINLNNPSGYIPNKSLGMIDDANSHFFAYLVTLMVLAVLFYLLFHNKQRIIALMIEGRGSRPSRRGGARAKYHKLDNNLEEAMGSIRSGGNGSLNNVY